MTFAEQLAADMAKMIDSDYFGSSATYVAPSGEETPLSVVLFDEKTETPENNGIKTKLRWRECTWAAATLADVNLRAKVRIGSDDWAISQLVYRDDYQVTVRLERHELYEHTRPDFRRR